jgi:hypothetical protein
VLVVGVTLSHALDVCASVTVGPPMQELQNVETIMGGELLVLSEIIQANARIYKHKKRNDNQRMIMSSPILSVAPFWQPLLELVPVEC